MFSTTKEEKDKLWAIPIVILTPNDLLKGLTLMRNKKATVTIQFDENHNNF